MANETAALSSWNESIDQYVDQVAQYVGVTRAAPSITEATGPYSFPLIRTLVTDDQIRFFADANGDANRLWRDSAYAESTTWGSIVAPPLFDACLSEGPWFPDPPQVLGWTMFGAGSRREYFGVFRPGDRVRAEDTFRGVEEKSSDKGYRLFLITGSRSFFNQDDELICTLDGRGIVTARPPSEDDGSSGSEFSNRQRRRFTDDELSEIWAGYERELRGETQRGADPRLWSHVQAGDDLPTIIKGPIDISDVTGFAGIAGLTPGYAIKWPMVRSDVGRRPVDPETGAPHFSIDWHFLDSVARQAGLPYAHVFVTQLEMMLAHLLTNWMGDQGVLKVLDVQVREPMFHGEAAHAEGTVTRTWAEDGHHFAEVKLSLKTQDGLKCVGGHAVIELPNGRR